ncbi:MAG: hypothetical protein ACP5RT_00865 [Candidatus Micrarchaeia archaeon]
MGKTFIINRLELRKGLAMLGVSDVNINTLEAELNRVHRHISAVTFAGLLQNIGVKQSEIINLFRRMGIDDVKITEIMNMFDEAKINEAYGRVVELNISD